jgi:hypothetical protein
MEAGQPFLVATYNPRFCLRSPSDGHFAATTLAFGCPSAPSAWVCTLFDICVKLPDITISSLAKPGTEPVNSPYAFGKGDQPVGRTILMKRRMS